MRRPHGPACQDSPETADAVEVWYRDHCDPHQRRCAGCEIDVEKDVRGRHVSAPYRRLLFDTDDANDDPSTPSWRFLGVLSVFRAAASE
jgi:hypothetical protein